MNTPDYYEKKRKTLTGQVTKLLTERDKLGDAKRPIAEKLRDLNGRLMYDKDNKALKDERDQLKAEQYMMGSEVRRVRGELQKLKKEWIQMSGEESIDRQRAEGKSQPTPSDRTEDY